MKGKTNTDMRAALLCLVIAFLTSCSNSNVQTIPAVTRTAATRGTGQSATAGTPFAQPLVVTVTSNGAPETGVPVTFTAPSSGPSGTFRNGTTTETDTTGAGGVAISSILAANTRPGAYAVTAVAAGDPTPIHFSLTNTTVSAPNVTAAGGTGQSTVTGTAFGAPLSVVVMSNGSPAGGISVIFTAPASGASGTFTNGTAIETETTGSNGVAVSSAFTANKTQGTYAVTATAAGDPIPAQFDLTNTSASATSYSFYLSGLDAICGSGNYYALAGSVTIDGSGNVVAGEQDYNDGNGCMSTEPAGDTITGGILTVDASGQGILNLTTSNSKLGMGGTETLGVQFVNSNHALIIQFDGSATSSGSMDLQTLPATLNGAYAFTLSGVDPSHNPVASGGVFSISGSSLANGVVDVNDMGTVTAGTTFTGSISTPDSFGRGTISGTPLANTIVYYVVGPEVMRIIDVDAPDSEVGSAFGQGSNTFTEASLGSSVFTVNASNYGVEYSLAGMFTVPSAGTLQGVADIDEQGWIIDSASPVAGTYSISTPVDGVSVNGYGSLTITPGSLGYFTTVGLYMTDPNLNLSDPNNTTGGGGALVLALDPYFAGGTGLVTPQTETATASFAGTYGFGAQDYYTGNPGWEFDFVGQGSVTNGTLNGTGLVSDPFAFFVAYTASDYSAVPFSGAATPDPLNAGRYTITLNVTAGGASVPFQVVIYQASGGELFWIDEDTSVTYPNNQIGTSLFSGSLQQQGSLSSLPGARIARGNMPVSRNR